MRRFAYQHLGFKVITPIQFFKLSSDDCGGALSVKPADCLKLKMDLTSKIAKTDAKATFKIAVDAVVTNAIGGSTVELAFKQQIFYDIRVIQKVQRGIRPLTFLEQCRWSENPATSDSKCSQWLGMLVIA